MTVWAKLIGLTPARRRLLVRAWLAVACFRLALSFLPFRWTRSLARRRETVKRRRRIPTEELAWAVTAAGRRVPRATCLTEALALESMLRREGHQANLRLGVTKTPDGALEAHAWLESGGRIVLGGPQSARFDELPLEAKG